MKSSMKKVWLSLLIGCAVLTASLVGGLTALSNRSANAADTPTTVEMKIDDVVGNDVTLVQGQEFTLTVTITSTRTDDFWSSVSFYVKVLGDDGKIDQDLSAKHTLVKCKNNLAIMERYPDGEDSDAVMAYKNTSTGYFGVASKNPSLSYAGLLLSVSNNSFGSEKATTSCVFTATIKLADDVPVDSTYKFAVGGDSINKVSYYLADASGNETTKTTADSPATGTLSSNVLNITVREASDDNTLKDLEVGHSGDAALTSLAVASETEGEPAVVPDAADYTSKNDDLTTFVVKPTANNDNAKIEIALNQQVTFTEIDSGDESDPLTLLDPTGSAFPEGLTHNTLYVKVTAENGEAKTYTVTVKIGYTRLDAITSTASTPTAGVTKNGLDLSDTSDAFDKETLTYNVFVPEDYDTDGGAVTVGANVLTGYGAGTTVALSAVGCDIYEADGATATTQLTSAGTVLLKNIAFPEEAGDPAPTLTLTATANDGVTTQAYTLTFVEVSVNAEIDTIVVTGVDSGTVFESDGTQATAQGADYYYTLTGEPQKKASVAITPKSTLASVAVTWTDTTKTETLPDYTNPTVYEEGEYTVTFTAEAGNTKSYKFVLVAALFLKLTDASEYQFVTEREEADEFNPALMLQYRRAYGEINWKHGVDDLTLDTVILGQVKPLTSVNEFIVNIEPTQLSMLKIYAQNEDKDGYNLIYNCGQPGDGFTSSDFDDKMGHPVGTGWYVTYGADDATADKVYISVLGDVDGNGAIDAPDVSDINAYIMDRKAFDTVLLRVTARVVNDGQISSADASTLNAIIMDRVSIEDFYFKPSTVTD